MIRNRFLFILFLTFFSLLSFSNTYTVTVLTDNGGVNPAAFAGTGTLRQAIIDANANAGADIINFNLGAGIPYTITLTAALPSLTDNAGVTIDGWENGANDGTPNTVAVFSATTGTPMNASYAVILANGANIPTGLVLASNNNIIQGLVLQDFGDGAPSTNDIEITITGNTNQILGCIIGLDNGGTTRGTKTYIGVSISGANNIIGNGTAATANIISGMNSNGSGIYITGVGATNNIVKGNMIGLQKDGSAAVMGATQRYGIYLTTSVANITIGGSVTGEGNVISGNTFSGVYSNSTLGTNNVYGNIIGLQADGATVVASNAQLVGVQLSDSPSNVIGGNTVTDIDYRNIISGNNNYGIYITGAASTGNTIKGNYIGLRANGINIVTGGSQARGLEIGSGAIDNTIGGIVAGEGNLISGNTSSGVYLASTSGNNVFGNIIGLQADGATIVASNPQMQGIMLSSSGNNVIGGNTVTDIDYRNIISGNNTTGIYVAGTSTNNDIKGNYIGLDISGTTFIAGSSQDNGIDFSFNTGSCIIGGALAGDGNVISGNSGAGIRSGFGSSLLTILSNIIGPQANGTSYVASNPQVTGISFAFTSTNSIIGGATRGNIISGNLFYGIKFQSASNNTIKGNYIGPGSGGVLIVGSNQDYGLDISSSSMSNVIGDTAAGEANIIAYNLYNGSFISGGGSIQNKISGNPHYSNNTNKPINLFSSGNINKPSPVISTATTSLVSGTSAPGDVVEVFKSTTGSCWDANVYLGSATANVTGNWSLSVSLIGNDLLLATARDASNNTSEFCPCKNVCSIVFSVQSVTICSNSSFTLPNGVSVNTVGIYYDTLTSFAGCDSIITTNLTVKPINIFTQSATICANNSYILPDGDLASNSGTYYDTLTSALGCDSIITTNLTVKPVNTFSQTLTICFGDSVLVGTTYYSSAGNYIDTIIGSNGCDSIVTTNLTERLLNAFSQTLTMCFGDSVLVGGVYYNSSGTFVDTITASNGCDSIITTNLTERPLNAIPQNLTICNGDSLLVGSTYYSASGTYQNTLTASNGCDSLVTTNLTVASQITFAQSFTICNGDTVTVGSSNYTNSGTYSNNFTSVIGCDSIVITTIIERPVNTTSQSFTMCFGDSMLIGSTYYYSSGTYVNVYADVNGCDSTVTSALTENPAITFSQNVTICFGDSILVGSAYYYNSGTYVNTLAAINGCDSTVTTLVNERPLNSVSQNVTICYGDSISIGGTYYFNSGTYTNILTAANGCDSVLTSTITELPMNTVTQNITICNGDSALVGNIYYYNSGTYIITISAANGCDSIVTTNITEKPLNSNGQTLTLCAGQSVTVGNNAYNTTGIYTNVFTGVGGCDSLYITNLTIIQPSITHQNITLICKDDTYVLPNGGIADSAGVYNDTLPAANGCDSIIITLVGISPAPIASFAPSSASGIAALWVGFTNTSQYSSVYQWTFGNGDSSAVTNPSILYNTAGTYTVMLIASNGLTCADTAYATITVFEKYDILIPNVFTPNDDGNNDYFTFPGEGAKTLFCEIYDRWGLKLYEWNGLNGSWNGYTMAGMPCPAGTYYYIMRAMDYADKKYVLTGFFTLIRDK